MMIKSPENLHKFYNVDSHFMHSDLTNVSIKFNLLCYSLIIHHSMYFLFHDVIMEVELIFSLIIYVTL